ncbi:MAG: DUF1697 domain-containing protein [Paracoccaceae bacterium]
MKTWVVLLRAVNVGGNNKLPMAAFRELLSGLQFSDVATYIQSGNAVFRAPGEAAAIGDTIAAAIRARFGFDTDVMMLTLAELRRALAANPFAQAEAEPTTLHLFFLSKPEPDFDAAAVAAAATRGEQFHLEGRILYFHTPNGMGKSDLARTLPRLIKAPMTGRNLRSCHKLAQMAGAL